MPSHLTNIPDLPLVGDPTALTDAHRATLDVALDFIATLTTGDMDTLVTRWQKNGVLEFPFHPPGTPGRVAAGRHLQLLPQHNQPQETLGFPRKGCRPRCGPRTGRRGVPRRPVERPRRRALHERVRRRDAGHRRQGCTVPRVLRLAQTPAVRGPGRVETPSPIQEQSRAEAGRTTHTRLHFARQPMRRLRPIWRGGRDASASEDIHLSHTEMKH